MLPRDSRAEVGIFRGLKAFIRRTQHVVVPGFRGFWGGPNRVKTW
jgi:hypothetical protein